VEGLAGRSVRLIELSSGGRVDMTRLHRDARRLLARISDRADPNGPSTLFPRPAGVPELVHSDVPGGHWNGSLRRLGDVLE
jgi:hypothetical protein